MVTRPGLCPIAQETALAALTLCTEYGPNGLDLDFAQIRILVPCVKCVVLLSSYNTHYLMKKKMLSDFV